MRRGWHGSYEVLREGGVFVGKNLEDVHLLELSVFAVVSLLKVRIWAKNIVCVVVITFYSITSWPLSVDHSA